jgi:uncharacterized membrane protein
MAIEMAAVAFDGAHTAEKELSALRTSRSDAWLAEVAVLEHQSSGRFSVKATNPDYGEEDHTGSGIAIGAGTGLLIGLIGGPIGLLFWTAAGAITGGAVGASDRVGTFDPLVAQVKDALPNNTSALILVAEEATSEELVAAVGERGRQVIRQELTQEQLDELARAAAAV